MREIVLDTETTGLSHRDGHRVVEIGCVELWDYIPTGKHYHTYIYPERDVSQGATRVSGLTTSFLKPYPLFSKIAHDFLNFIEETTLIIHNASFDVGFLNAELMRLNLPLIGMPRVIDTVTMARQLFPGSPANLDALCKRFHIDLSKRDKHGALLDAELLAKVYLELRGGRQRKIHLEEEQEEIEQSNPSNVQSFPLRKRNLLPEEDEEHRRYTQTIPNALWQKI